MLMFQICLILGRVTLTLTTSCQHNPRQLDLNVFLQISQLSSFVLQLDSKIVPDLDSKIVSEISVEVRDHPVLRLVLRLILPHLKVNYYGLFEIL